jgi:hypothetical protein
MISMYMEIFPLICLFFVMEAPSRTFVLCRTSSDGDLI